MVAYVFLYKISLVKHLFKINDLLIRCDEMLKSEEKSVFKKSRLFSTHV